MAYVELHAKSQKAFSSYSIHALFISNGMCTQQSTAKHRIKVEQYKTKTTES